VFHFPSARPLEEVRSELARALPPASPPFDSKLQVATCFGFQGLGFTAGRLLDVRRATWLGGLGVGVGSFSSILLLQVANTPRLS